MSCPCKICVHERAGPFEIPHHTIKIKCRECGARACARAADHHNECSNKLTRFSFPAMTSDPA